MSDWGWILAGGAAVTGFLGMFWGYVKSLWSQLASRLVMSCEIRGGLAEAVGCTSGSTSGSPVLASAPTLAGRCTSGR